MKNLRQQRNATNQPERGASARTRRLMMETAIRMMQDGLTPSISDVADAAEVSRATSYRYFPSQAALIQDVIAEALGPILDWTSDSDDAEQRVSDLFEASFPRIHEFEATFRAALKLSLDNWAAERATKKEGSHTFERGHRLALLDDALSPLRSKLSKSEFKKLVEALSLIFGVEPLIVLKDISGLKPKEILAQTQWIAKTMIRAAVNESKKGSK